MRQEIRLLGGKLKMIIYIYILNQGYLANGLPNCIQAYKTNMTKLRIYTPQITCQCARENQIENVISHAANENNTI
jgi:hypothetical protein